MTEKALPKAGTGIYMRTLRLGKKCGWIVALSVCLTFAILRLPGMFMQVIIDESEIGYMCVFKQDRIAFESPILLLVRERGEMKPVGYPEDFGNGIGYASAAWSRDGTVVVTLTEGVEYMAYDFARNEKLMYHQIIPRLQERGGYGKDIFSWQEGFEGRCHHPWLWELPLLKYD